MDCNTIHTGGNRMTAVQVNHVTKTYEDKTAINDLSFSVAPGEILDLIGPNGAGKSTTIRIILDFIKLGILGLSIIGGLLLAIKVFRVHLLMYGKRPSFGEIIHNLKSG